jgi:hypothetical protein
VYAGEAGRKDALAMSCPDLRRASCGRGGSAATLAVTGMVALAAWWAFENPAAVIMTVAASLVLSVAMVSLLARSARFPSGPVMNRHSPPDILDALASVLASNYG